MNTKNLKEANPNDTAFIAKVKYMEELNQELEQNRIQYELDPSWKTDKLNTLVFASSELAQKALDIYSRIRAKYE